MRIEFLDEPPPERGARESDRAQQPDRDAAPSAAGRGRRLGLMAAVALAGLAATVALRSHGTGSGTLPTEPPPPAPAPQSVVAQQIDLALAAVSGRLGDPKPARDLTRESSAAGDCRPVKLGTSPERAAVRVVRHWFPHFVERDYGRVIDQFAGLCLAELRGGTGTMRILVRVVSPDKGTPMRAFDAVAFHSENDGGTLTSCVTLDSGNGWHLLVGSIGPLRDSSSAELNAIALDPRLRW